MTPRMDGTVISLSDAAIAMRWLGREMRKYGDRACALTRPGLLPRAARHQIFGGST
jgi:hypothetical protein